MIQVLERAFKLLETLDDERYNVAGIGVIALSEKINLKTPTVHNLLKTLVNLGYVEQVARSKYRLSSKTARLGHVAGNQILLRQVCEKFATDLNHKFNETIVVANYSQGSWQSLFELESKQQLKVSGLGITNNLYISATGRCILGSFSQGKRDKYVKENGLPSSSLWPKVKNETQLNKELDAIREKGYAIMESTDIFAIAAPLCSPRHSVFAAIGLYMPQSRLTKKMERELLKELLPIAKTIIETIG